ncbi:helicase-related protein [Intestinibacter bartlettii]|uniref:helicase-related protein n=1 Tax=Intestinibacter bartlettii TaxID=261299 RepID=UPI003991FCEC
MEKRDEFIEARKLIYEEVKKELLGPGSEDISGNKEHEIITDDPISRYSLGILFPVEDSDTSENNDDIYEGLLNDIDDSINRTNETKPSSMGITFFAKGEIKQLSIRISAAKYRKSTLNDCRVIYEGEDFFKYNELKKYIYREEKFLKLEEPLDYKIVSTYLNTDDESEEYKYFKNVVYTLIRQCRINNKSKDGFVRVPLPIDKVLKIDLDGNYSVLNIENEFFDNVNVKMSYNLQICIYTRKYSNNIKSYTVVLCNNEEYESFGRDEKSIFQPQIEISTDDNPGIIFIENRNSDIIDINLDLDDEEINSELLYRDKKNYGIGHGVSTMQYVDITTGLGKIKTSFIPVYEVKGMDFNLKDISTEVLSMKNLSDYSNLTDTEIISNLKIIVNKYNEWIKCLEKDVENFNGVLKKAALKNIAECKICSKRIDKGIEILKNNNNAFLAFKLMNRALFMQRIQTQNIEQYKERYPDDEKYPLKQIDFRNESYDKGVWRAFQIGYILMCLESIVNPYCNDRDIVDLIWVPTGGGKTEAYLGLTAFVIFLRKIENNKDNGTAVIMRYTLRLLTSQQFIRASMLICACELIRKENPKLLGKDRITIGIWIGGDQTPNTKKQAKEKYNDLIKYTGNFKKSQNPFQILKCPWCGTKLEKENINGKQVGKWGYNFDNKNNSIFCTDNKCEFSRRIELPIEVVDEFIYENPPTLLFGTVDKFAMITWKGEARNLFALNPANKNKSPELIIQDELHLISGPLGSIVGEYETTIDLLCSEKGIKPKIIASTATIKRAKEQCNQLYVRDVRQFPPSGLSQKDSFFVKEDDNNPGRLYVGIMGAGKTLTTTQVRLMSALTNRVNMLDIKDEIKSEYWTLVCYFNTLKELGMTRNLIDADIQQNINTVTKRLLYYKPQRNLFNKAELTSRVNFNDINNTLKNLELGLLDRDKEKKQYPIDILLASNMISVGVDISRLNLMMVLEQPKLTAEYIQATSRVGRRHPGIVFTLYNPTRSRDRSHYENFYDYHQSFYKYVEPTSVTSFSEPAVERMLQSVFIALIRHIVGLNENKSASEFSRDNTKIDIQVNHILERVQRLLLREGESEEIIKQELEEIKIYLEDIIYKWENKIQESDELFYDAKGKPSLLQRFDSLKPRNNDINVLTSMRNVDGQAKVDIILFEGEEDE